MDINQLSPTSIIYTEIVEQKPKSIKHHHRTSSARTSLPNSSKHKLHQSKYSKLILSLSNDKQQSPLHSSKHIQTQTNSNPKSSSAFANVKTVFTKITESIYSQIKDNIKLRDCYSYERYINDTILYSYADKYIPSNSKKIKNFLDRTAENNHKKLSGIKKHHKSISVTLINNKDNSPRAHDILLTSQDSKVKQSKSPVQFFDKLAKYSEIKEKKRNALKEYYSNLEKQNCKDKPQINLYSKELNDIHRNKKSKSNNNNIYPKLVKGNNDNEKEKYLTLEKSKKNKRKDKEKRKVKKKSDKSIQVIVNRLSSNYSKEPRDKSASDCITNTSINEDSVSMLIKKMINQYDIQMNTIFNAKTEDNVLVSYDQFVQLLYNMGFTSQNYVNCINSINKEYTTLQDAWGMLLTKNLLNESNGKVEKGKEERIHSHYLLLFILSLMHLYKGKEAKDRDTHKEESPNIKHQLISKKTITLRITKTNKGKTIATFRPKLKSKSKMNLAQQTIKDIPFIIEDEYSFDSCVVKQIIAKFRLFYNNRKEYEDQLSKVTKKKKMNKAISNPDLTFKPKTNKRDDFSNIYLNAKGETTKKTNIYEAYAIYRLRKANELKLNLSKKIKQELKDCTFSPKINKHYTPSYSFQDYDPLNSLSNNRLITFNNNTTDNELQCSFRPQLTEYNSKVFTNNPLKEDKQLLKGLERYQMARIDRQSKEFIANQVCYSYNNLKWHKDITKDMERSELKKDFRFNNEVKSNRDSFDKFKKPDCYVYKKDRNLMFVFEIIIENEIKLLLYYKGEDIVNKAELFCRKNRLDDDSMYQIISAIQTQLDKSKKEWFKLN